MRVPVLCWRLADEAIIGRVLFVPDGPAEIARPTVPAVVSTLAEELRRGGISDPIEVEEPNYRRFIVPVRARWKLGDKTMYAPDPVDIPVDVVWASTDTGLRIAEIATFQHIFHFEDAAHLEVLVAQAVRELTSGWPPERLIGYLFPPVPTLESVIVREGDVGSRPRKDAVPARLAAIAVRVPEPTRATFAPSLAWERDTEVKRLAALLSAGTSAVVTGDPRVGKTAVLRAALRDVAGRGAGDSSERRRTVWRTTAHRMVAGAKYLGEWQELCDQLVDDLQTVNGTLWVEDLAELASLGGTGVDDSVAAYLQPALASGRLRLVGELSARALDTLRGKLPTFFGHFETVPLAELSPDAVRAVVARLAASFEAHHQIVLAPEARALAIGLTTRHLPAERMPGKVVSFLAGCAADAAREGRTSVREADVLAAFVRRTGMPAVLVDDRLPLSAATLDAWLARRIVGQPAALAAAIRVVLSFKAGLADPHRPIATLLFAGPTGVGKTATAKALAEWCFGQGQVTPPLVRIDMSELQHPAQVARLIGDARDPGELVRQIRERPFSVLLLDEIEKAHPIFFDTLMTVLDEGTVSDSLGRVTDFRRCIIVMTTNLGASAGTSAGFGERPHSTSLVDVRRHFRPEFFNRIDQVVPFAPLDVGTIDQIAAIELEAVGRREGLRLRRLTLRYGDAMVAHVARKGFDPRWGARLLQRTVEAEIVAPLARFLLDNPSIEGAEIFVDLEDGRAVIVAV